jgi:hypothetical protein
VADASGVFTYNGLRVVSYKCNYTENGMSAKYATVRAAYLLITLAPCAWSVQRLAARRCSSPARGAG